MVLLLTLVMKLYTSAPTRKNFEIECGKSICPILPNDVAVGTDDKSLLKFSFTISEVCSLTTKPIVSPQNFMIVKSRGCFNALPGLPRLTAAGIFNKEEPKSSLVIE